MMPYALGVAGGAILWNLIFLALSAIGLLSGEATWMMIKYTLGVAGAWLLLAIGIEAANYLFTIPNDEETKR